MLSLRDLWAALGGTSDVTTLPVQELTDVVIDSRQATPGSCFVALPGENTDGHEFVGQAFEQGAVVALVSHKPALDCPLLATADGAPTEAVGLPFCILVNDGVAALQQAASWWRRHLSLRVIGITGSVGKTSTKDVIYSVLRQRFSTMHSPGNLNNEIGLPLTLLRLDETYEAAVIEMGMYTLGEIAHLAEIAQPQIGLVTNVGPSHMERLGSIESIAHAKSELVQALPHAPEGVAILNMDDPRVRIMAETTQARVFFYGLTPDADLWASDIEARGLEGIRFYFHYDGQVVQVRVPLLGRHSVHTALGASAVGLVAGLSWEEIVAGLTNLGAQLRLVAVPGINGSTLLDDTYNASPASTIAALNLLADLDGRRVAVLGEMLELGEFEEEGHHMVGLRAADVADLLVGVGERAHWIVEGAMSAGMPVDRVSLVEGIDTAIALLREQMQPDDMVLIKGSRATGMELLVTALSRQALRQ